MKHKKFFLSLFLSFSFVFALASCSNQNKAENNTSVTFVLNGGKYKNSDENITYNYKLNEGGECLIKSPDDFKGSSSSTILLQSKHIKNWFVADSEGKATNTVWDFENDKLKYGDKLTLIANWALNTKFQFKIYYKDASNNVEEVTTLNVDAGQSISAYSSNIVKACRGKNITFLGNYYDADGNKVAASDLVMPSEAEEDVVKAVYIDYIDGLYTLVNDYNSLTKAFTSITGDNIYLLNDIDCGGKTLKLGSDGVLNKLIIKGNGYTIKNFKVNFNTSRNSKYIKQYKESDDKEEVPVLSIGLFNTITDSSIENVTFDDVLIDVSYNTVSVNFYQNILISPLTFEINSSKLSNVLINASYSIGNIPYNIDKNNIIVIDDNYVETDGNSTITNTKVNLTKKED